MKKPGLIAIAIIALTSCQKEKCWQCVDTTNYYAINTDSLVNKETATNVVCDKTAAKIADYENLKSEETESGNMKIVKQTKCTAE